VLKILEVSFPSISILVFKADAFSGNEINFDRFSSIEQPLQIPSPRKWVRPLPKIDAALQEMGSTSSISFSKKVGSTFTSK
jgi:hypothetical protein